MTDKYFVQGRTLRFGNPEAPEDAVVFHEYEYHAQAHADAIQLNCSMGLSEWSAPASMPETNADEEA